jgi:hypothetical protein
LSFTSFSYPVVSAAKAFKKRLKVLPLTVFPLKNSHSALAVCKRCRFDLTVSKISNVSDSLFISDFLPRPAFTDKPLILPDLYQFNQLFYKLFLNNYLL